MDNLAIDTTRICPPPPIMLGYTGGTASSVTGSSTQTTSSYDEEQKKLAESLKKCEEDAKNLAELEEIKKRYQKQIDEIRELESIKNDQKSQLEKNKTSDGSSKFVDKSTKGFGRWLSNGLTSLKNIGKSFIGYDEKGNRSAKKCLTNVGISALAIGACFIPVVGPVISAGLIGTGIIGGAYGAYKGYKNLEKAEKSGDQQKIDEAQQNICGNVFIAATSALGIKGLKGIKTSIASDKALVASKGFSRAWGSKISTGVKNLGGNFKGKYDKQLTELKTNLGNRLAKIDEELLTETDYAKRVLLLEEKQLIEANLAEVNSIGTTIKSKRDFDKLASDNAALKNKEGLETAYTRNTYGKYTINGIEVTDAELNIFKNRIIEQQTKLAKEIEELVKAKENMMRAFAGNLSKKKHKTELNEYITVNGSGRKWLSPGSWTRNKYQNAIGGTNPKQYGKYVFLTTCSAQTVVPKGLAQWASPVYSDPILNTEYISAEDLGQQLQILENDIEIVKKLRETIENAKTKEEFEGAMQQWLQLTAPQQPVENAQQQTGEKANS